MIQVLPAIVGGKVDKIFVTSDHCQHETYEEADWHEFITNELEVDALTFEFPKSNCVMTLKSEKDLEKFLVGEYADSELKILTNIKDMKFPNRYIMIESKEYYGVENILVKYMISFTEINEFKRKMIDRISSL